MEDKADNHKCEKCSKVFTLKKNLRQHIKIVHEKQKLHECGLCQKKFGRKQHKELHLRTCSRNVQGGKLQGKSYKAIPNLKFSPILRHSSFGGIAADWIIHFPDDYKLVDPTVLLQTSTKSMKEIITKHLYDHTKRLKFTMSIHVVFEQATDSEVKTSPPVVLTTDPYTVWSATNLDEVLTEAAKELFDKIETYEGCGSNWILDHLDRLDTEIRSF